MSILLMNSQPQGLTSISGPDGTLFLYGDEVNIEISPKCFCLFVEEFLYIKIPSFTGGYGDNLIQSVSKNGVEIRYEEQIVRLILEDYIGLIKYFFTNTDLLNDDPRLAVVNKIIFSDLISGENLEQKKLFDWLSKLELVSGWNVDFYPDAKRFNS